MENLEEKQRKIKKNLLKYGIREEKFEYNNSFLINPHAWLCNKEYRVIFRKRAKLIKEEHIPITQSTLNARFKDLKDCRVIEFEVYMLANNGSSVEEKIPFISYFERGEEAFEHLSERLSHQNKNLFLLYHDGDLNAYHIYFSDDENKKLEFKDLEIIVDFEK
ncbi:MAG: hypothetical protein PHD81_02085 [Candidatus Nanoarchaeia archaeon]|nr:hypothetical protein [Candidatus Nanoarchaeia archaeon]MDD5587879.1 hypothetical protein [Candidatus Nanoarchaeia archaeon]